eukprot:6820280-Prymnesium_polylepis.1
MYLCSRTPSGSRLTGGPPAVLLLTEPVDDSAASEPTARSAASEACDAAGSKLACSHVDRASASTAAPP